MKPLEGRPPSILTTNQPPDMNLMVSPAPSNHAPARALDVFFAFLKLGLTAFGGPVAHLGYFRKEFVERRQWLSEHQFGQLLAICQFLPGPASSQLGFCIGLLRAGWLGALLAFLAFTLPSVVLLIIFAASLPMFSNAAGAAAIHGLKLVACAVVADAVLGMAKKLCPDIPRQSIAVLVVAALLVWPSAAAQLLVVVLAAIAGMWLIRDRALVAKMQALPISYGRRVGVLWLGVFAALLMGLPLLAVPGGSFIAVADVFYRAGALVFGGGHVVLPLLQEALVEPSRLSAEQFLAGYGAAQAIPGPMFSFAAYLGAVLAQGENTLLVAATALCFIFLPGFLLVAGVLPFWRAIADNATACRALAGVNAAVVGLLAATLYNPIFTTAIINASDLAIAAVAFGLLTIWRLSPLVVVAWCVLASMLPLLF